MRSFKIFSCFIFSLVSMAVQGQKPVIELLDSAKSISLRGLSVASDQVIWVSGNRGTVAKSTDGGKHFEWIKVKGFENRDFRDIEVFDANTALIMGVDAPAIILKTTDGGRSWKIVLEDSTKGMFLDAMHFDGDRKGVLVGDPINHQIYLAYTEDQGETWHRSDHKPSAITAKEGEAFFASSGTNIFRKNNQRIFVSGGMASSIYWDKTIDSIPILQGLESTGANSIAVTDKNHAVIVGGDFKRDTLIDGNCILYNHRSRSFTKPITSPHGYRSCVVFLFHQTLLCCGTSGVDISYDGGLNWSQVSRDSFHVAQKAKNGNSIFLTGANGRIARLIF